AAPSTAATTSYPHTRPSATCCPLLIPCQYFAKEDTMIAVLDAALHFDVAEFLIVRDILGHALMGVEANLAKAARACPLLDEVHQRAPQPRALIRGIDCNVFEEVVIHDREADDHTADRRWISEDIHNAVCDQMCIVGEHRTRLLA